jgi:hypothetical protein
MAPTEPAQQAFFCVRDGLRRIHGHVLVWRSRLFTGDRRVIALGTRQTVVLSANGSPRQSMM